jgi:threonine aldolase
MAETLGKEAALFLPTGTLANQVAIRVLSGLKSHVVVQDHSHVFRDEYDMAQIMSGRR